MYCIFNNKRTLYDFLCMESEPKHPLFQCSTGSWGAEFWSRIQGVCREGMSRRGICTREISQESEVYRNCQVNIISQINIILQIKAKISQESQVYRDCQVNISQIKVKISQESQSTGIIM